MDDQGNPAPFDDEKDDELEELFNAAEAAPEWTPLPRGRYEVVPVRGEFFEASTGTRGYTISFEVTAGAHAGHRLYLRLWFTPSAVGRAKRLLLALGITNYAQLREPVPQCRLQADVVLRRDDSGRESNEVRALRPLGPPPAALFAPAAVGA